MFDVWKNVLAILEKKLSHEQFVTYFSNTTLRSSEGGEIQIGVPNIFIQAQMKKKFDAKVREALKACNVEVANVEYVVFDNKNKVKKAHEVIARNGKPEKISTMIGATEFNNDNSTGLNSKYTLDNFVVGQNNNLAVSVAKNVIENPGTKFNPFFIYSGPGLGKTHLVQAVGNELLRRNPKLKILYTPTSHFYSGFVSSLQKKTIDAFKSKYQKLDVLIMDDFQMIVGKNASQEYFFELFNDMQNSNKQVIITSDRLPNQIKDLDERLYSRLMMCGSFDLQMPSFEDRCAILKAKAEFDGVEIEDEAIEYIAENVKTNIRDLQGDYTRLVTLADLKGVTPMELINGGFTNTAASSSRGKSVSPKKIMEKVARHYNLSVDEMCAKTRVAHIKNARQVTMYMLSEELGLSTPKIASLVGMKDHTTVMHGIKKIKTDIKMNFGLRDELQEIKEHIYE